MTFSRIRRFWPALLLVGLLFRVPARVHAATPKVPEGFEIRLVAAVPAVQYPCQVATAPDGSLFVAEDPMDQIGPADKPIDRILVFREGKDPVVFAEKLNAVFGMVWHDGALYVMNMPNLTVLRDTDGDGQADQRKELFTDLGVPAGQPNMFNDHIVSGLQIGIDGYLYISVGDKGVPRATGPDGRTATVRGGGILRCRLDGTELEVYSNGTRNHLEPNLDARDNLFTYDNTDDGLGWWTRVTHHIDGGYYGYPWDYHDRTDRMLNRMAEYGGGSPCGGFVYKEDVWPEKYRGRGFWAEWAKRVVRCLAFEPEGASFKLAEEFNFVEPGESNDFRPLDLALSYDGRTMYIADWSFGGWNNKTEKLGRVYAVTYTGEVKTRPRGKDSDPIPSQIAQLDHPSFNERFRAQTALAKRGKEVLGPVREALSNLKTDPVARRHLVWVLDAVAGATPEATMPIMDALNDPAADVRAQAARALGERGVAIAVEPLVKGLNDSDPSVRLHCLIALGRIGDASAVSAVAPFVADADPYLAFGARVALRRIGDWKGIAAALASSESKVRLGLLLALEMVHSHDAVRALADFASDLNRDAAERARAVFLLAQAHHKPVPWDGKWWGTQPARTRPPAKTIEWDGTPLVLASVRERLNDPSSVVRLAAIVAEREMTDPKALPMLRDRFVKESEVDVRSSIARTLGVLGDRDSLPLLIAALRDRTAPDPVRDAALESVETIGTEVALKALLEMLDSGALGVDRQPSVIAALGRFKTRESNAALLQALKSASPTVRAAAADAIGKVGKAEDAGPPLRELLADASVEVRKEAISALGQLRVRDAIPELIEASHTQETRFEAAEALASMPDLRALPVYLRGLSDRSPELRRRSVSALTRIREEAVPVLEQLAARKELPSTALPELRRVYLALRPITDWHVIGPFPMKANPPFSPEGLTDLTAHYDGFGDQTISWKTAHAIDDRGQIDLGAIYRHDDDLVAYAYAEVESPVARRAEMAVGSDDTVTVWVNGDQVHDYSKRRGFRAEEDRFPIKLVKGKSRILIRCGNHGGGWQFSAAVTTAADHAFLKGPAPGAFDPENFRQFAMKADGKVDHGRALFGDLKGLACIKCHSVNGQGGAVGPELSSVGAKYPKDELISSVLYPSAKISSGYEPVVIATVDGKVVTGIIKGETPEAVEIDDSDAKRLRITKEEIEERKRSDVSLMPNGLAEGLSPEDFADLIAYLQSLKDAKPAPGGGK